MAKAAATAAVRATASGASHGAVDDEAAEEDGCADDEAGASHGVVDDEAASLGGLCPRLRAFAT